MVTVMCWLVLHTSDDGLDNRSYKKIKGYVQSTSSDHILVNFNESFTKMGVNMEFNWPVQNVQDSECSYKK